mmetsp:Transcript_9586/g.29765  ORF Transcript_9586/g.29765 Transcript_9586/m.29765 type:complete len:219 (+) Transcript_9586:263-919(+)
MGTSERPMRSATKRPVTISVMRRPRAQQSSPGDCGKPCAASGDMYGMFSLLLTAGPLLTYSAQPRSTSTARPRSLTSTFSDQTSRCTRPRRCISDSAPATCGTTFAASAAEGPLRRISLERGSESATYSIAMHRYGGSLPTCGTRFQQARASTRRTMLGCSSSRITWTSRQTRDSSPPVSLTSFREITLTANLRLLRRSCARMTTPKLPEPIFTLPCV